MGLLVIFQITPTQKLSLANGFTNLKAGSGLALRNGTLGICVATTSLLAIWAFDTDYVAERRVFCAPFFE